MTANAIIKCLETVLQRIAPEAVPGEFASGEFLFLFSTFGWRLRHLTSALSKDEHSFLKAAGLVAPDALSMADIARIHLLLCTLNRLFAEEQAGFVDMLFRKGDNNEREALLRGLVLLPSPAQFLATAIDACRVAAQTTFEAIACENAYPEKYFPTESFRAMVLKALYLGVPVHRIHGLDKRMDSSLSRAATDYTSELKAAGKSVPTDVAIIEEGGIST